MRPIPGDVIQNAVRDGRNDAGLVQISMTPHGFLKLAATRNARVDGRSVTMTIGKYSVSGVINEQNLVESVETRLANNVLGDVAVRTVFSGYKDYGGVKFPSHVVQTQGGHPTLDLNVSDVQPNSAAARALSLPTSPPAAPPSTSVKTEPQKIADGVWFLDGGAPMSVLVEFSDHVVIIEGPQNDERTEATIAAVKQLLPSKPIRYVVNTHQHFDHSGGIRAYVAAGIPVVTHEKNKPYWERVLKNPFTLEPDRLARASRAPKIETVGEKRVLSDSSMALELHHLKGNLHDETLLVAYLPKQKLLVQADAFHPRPGAKPLAAPPPFTVNLVENIRRLKLDVERVVHLHGGIDSMATVTVAAGLSARRPPIATARRCGEQGSRRDSASHRGSAASGPRAPRGHRCRSPASASDASHRAFGTSRNTVRSETRPQMEEASGGSSFQAARHRDPLSARSAPTLPRR
jgi:glyoxylase-like metal-dependent hydrolase (beta-lactamase superfamily II)